ncbi:MAG: Hsp33 family molecular chaperone HslO [Ruminococcaceae bacterium]|nr:Hsp33 family molecular chaperone HslO [Oscillospiraceae bacterium]
MKDILTRALTKDGSVRAFVINSKNIVSKAFDIHKTSPVVTVALGRVLTVASIMGAMQKEENSALTLNFCGGGAAGNLVAVSDNQGNVRGYAVNPVVDLPLNSKGQLNVKAAVGVWGSMSIIRDLGNGKNYNGTVPIEYGEIAQDITDYYTKSEQIPTVCALGVSVEKDWSVKSAGGFLVQLMPNAQDETVDILEKNINKIKSVNALFEGDLTNRDILNLIFEGIDYSILSTTNPEYKCTCSQERTLRAILSLGKEELEKMADDEKIETTCHFCNKKYSFDPKEVLSLLK